MQEMMIWLLLNHMHENGYLVSCREATEAFKRAEEEREYGDHED
jgi:hypothetical protein